MRRIGLLVAVAVLALATAAAPAGAHPRLTASSPAAEAIAPAPPREVVLTFSEPVVSRSARGRITAPGGRSIRAGAARARGGREIVVPLRERMGAAVYDLRWSVVGDDGHTLSGTLRFGVARAGGAPPPGVERLRAAAVTATSAGASDGPLEVALRWLGLVAAGVLLALAVVGRSLGAAPARPAGPPRLATAAVVALLIASWYAALAAAGAGGADRSVELLVAQAGGILALVRIGLVAVLAALATSRRWTGAGRRAILGAAGAGALVTYALEGHAQASTPTFGVAAQIVHVLAAGLWVGGLVVLAASAPRTAAALRAFAPLAALSVAALVLTGLVAAFREVDAWYFLRWSDYGRVAVAKAILLLALAPVVAMAAIALRRGRPARRLLRLEAAGALAIVVLAAILAGLPPGRGQALPAQRGNLLVGAAFATVDTPDGPLRLTLAPARPGENTITASPATATPEAAPSSVPRAVAAGAADPAEATVSVGSAVARDGSASAGGRPALAVTLRCACAGRPIPVRLRLGPGGTWSATVRLPATGSYVATADGSTASAALPVGDARVRGSTPRTVLMTADLSGSAARRCRTTAQGAVLALGRANANGGLPGGRKLALRVVDDGGDPRRAAAITRAHPDAIALLAPCGAGAGAALTAARHLPAIAAEPSAPTVARRHLWRVAGDPAAEGAAVAAYLQERIPADDPRTVAVVRAAAAGDEAVTVRGGEAGTAARTRVAALADALEPSGIRVVAEPPTRAGVLRALDRERHAGVLLDGDADRLAPLLRAAGRDAVAGRLHVNVVVAASALLDEGFQERAGDLGSTGVIATPSEVLPQSVDGVRLVRQWRALFPSDRPGIAGLRGYVAGLALAEGVRQGEEPSQVAERLRRPAPFTDALVAPWREGAPQAGAPLYAFLSPRFLPPALAGDEGHRGEGWFTAGTWTRAGGQVYGTRR